MVHSSNPRKCSKDREWNDGPHRHPPHSGCKRRSKLLTYMATLSRELLRAFDDCKTGNLKDLKQLIADGVPIDATLPFTRIFDVSCLNANMLQVASAYGRINTVDFLLNSQKIDVNYREGNGHYALHFAALGRHNQIIEMLLRRRADWSCRNFQGLTPLHFGCKLGGTDSIRCLVAKGADVNAVSYDTETTPLHIACDNQQLQTAKVLIELGANVNAATKDGWTALHFAARAANLGLVRELLASKASVDVVTKDRDTALHMAARVGSVVEIFPALCRCGVVARDRAGVLLSRRLILPGLAGFSRYAGEDITQRHQNRDRYQNHLQHQHCPLFLQRPFWGRLLCKTLPARFRQAAVFVSLVTLYTKHGGEFFHAAEKFFIFFFCSAKPAVSPG